MVFWILVKIFFWNFFLTAMRDDAFAHVDPYPPPTPLGGVRIG